MHSPGRTREAAEALGDFTTTPRTLVIAALSLGIGVVSVYVAKALLLLIDVATNFFYFGRLGTEAASPVDSPFGWPVVFVPVAGGLIIGLMARFGSDRIRGHGIPEAIESILIHGSRVQPKVAVLKPVSSAISIGSGGPFGAEGPIIMTGGAIGSVIAQFFHLTSAERKTLLVSGAAAGMSATFAAPVASALLAVELLLFEWKPRSFVPVALAAATAAGVRQFVIGPGPLFPVPVHPATVGAQALLGCVLAGILAGGLSALLTSAVYAAEDGFARLPIHWMWWPALGGAVVGLGGLLFPQALGVGYETIGALLQGEVTGRVILGVLIVKSVIWCVSLGSGTSGGVLAPLLMMGGALGGVEAWVLPEMGGGFWPLVSMGAILAGTMRAPLTGVVFLVELTHDVNMLLPLLIAAGSAHALTVLVLKRSILTEKIARRGYHMTREYAIDPLEILSTREVMRTSMVALPIDAPLDRLEAPIRVDALGGPQRLYPIVDEGGRLKGVITRFDLHQHVARARSSREATIHDVLRASPAVAHPDEPLRVVVHRMASTGLTQFPVVERDSARLLGMLTLEDLLTARTKNLEAEQRRERLLRVRLAFPFGLGRFTG